MCLHVWHRRRRQGNYYEPTSVGDGDSSAVRTKISPKFRSRRYDTSGTSEHPWGETNITRANLLFNISQIQTSVTGTHLAPHGHTTHLTIVFPIEGKAV